MRITLWVKTLGEYFLIPQNCHQDISSHLMDKPWSNVHPELTATTFDPLLTAFPNWLPTPYRQEPHQCYSWLSSSILPNAMDICVRWVQWYPWEFIDSRPEWILGGMLKVLRPSTVQSLSHVRLFVIPWTAARQTSLYITISWSLLRLMSIRSVVPSNHLILCCPLLPSVLSSIRVFSNVSSSHQVPKVLELQL